MPTYSKTKELIFIINRLAANIKYQPLGNKLESWSLKLLEELALDDLKKSTKSTTVLRSLVDFGRSIYEIEPINADFVIQELDKLNAAIRQKYSLPDLPDFFKNSSEMETDGEIEDREDGRLPVNPDVYQAQKQRQKSQLNIIAEEKKIPILRKLQSTGRQKGKLPHAC